MVWYLSERVLGGDWKCRFLCCCQVVLKIIVVWKDSLTWPVDNRVVRAAEVDRTTESTQVCFSFVSNWGMFWDLYFNWSYIWFGWKKVWEGQIIERCNGGILSFCDWWHCIAMSVVATYQVKWGNVFQSWGKHKKIFVIIFFSFLSILRGDHDSCKSAQGVKKQSCTIVKILFWPLVVDAVVLHK